MTPLALPRLYVIADADTLRARALPLHEFAAALHSAGVTILQWRDKHSTPARILADAVILRTIFPPTQSLLILNDHPGLALHAHFNGVHLGQSDLSPAAARTLLPPPSIIGLSTHTLAQFREAATTSADYIALGPIFPTSSKQDASPAVGLDLLRRARALTTKPIVAIGGITRQNAASVLAAGADSLAVISGLFSPGETVEQVARDFLSLHP